MGPGRAIATFKLLAAGELELAGALTWVVEDGLAQALSSRLVPKVAELYQRN
jgi:hypothetical protein